MKAGDIMTSSVVSVDSETPVKRIAKLMSERQISAVPVIDADHRVIGIISEGDLLRRAETGTARQRSWWLELLATNKELAGEYLKSHGRTAKDVMTREVVTVKESTPLSEVADILESRHIKRVPVLRNGKLVGIVSRANLVQLLASARLTPPASSAQEDRAIREKLLAELKTQKWADASPGNIVVTDRIVHLWGQVLSDEEQRALRAAAANIPGVRAVKDHTNVLPVVPIV